jgi:hypothetical protein
MSLRNGLPPSARAVANHATARRAASANSSITRPVVSGDPLTRPPSSVVNSRWHQLTAYAPAPS